MRFQIHTKRQFMIPVRPASLRASTADGDDVAESSILPDYWLNNHILEVISNRKDEEDNTLWLRDLLEIWDSPNKEEISGLIDNAERKSGITAQRSYDPPLIWCEAIIALTSAQFPRAFQYLHAFWTYLKNFAGHHGLPHLANVRDFAATLLRERPRVMECMQTLVAQLRRFSNVLADYDHSYALGVPGKTISKTTVRR
jgi:hypothetical protein